MIISVWLEWWLEDGLGRVFLNTKSLTYHEFIIISANVFVVSFGNIKKNNLINTKEISKRHQNLFTSLKITQMQ